MRRAPIGALLLGAASVPHPAGATATGPRPEIVAVVFVHPPIHARTEENLRVRAVDVDGVLAEVQVEWGDQSLTEASTYCVQGDEIGAPAKLLIPHRYLKAGSYRVRVRAVSLPTC